jgi:hypothetical protein
VIDPLGQPDLCQHCTRVYTRLGFGHAPNAQRRRRVVERGELRQQVMELADKAELLVAPFALGCGAHLGKVAPA